MFRNCKSVFIATFIYIITFSNICFAREYGVSDRSEILDKLKNEYGFSINIPNEYTDPEYGFVVTDKNRLLTFLAKPPTSSSEDSNEKLEIYVKKSMSNMHVFICTGDSLDKDIISEITACADCTPVDFRSGTPINKPAIKSSTFTGHRWFPPSIEKFYEAKSDELIGCQRDTVYKDKEYVVATSYLVLPDFRITVAFEILPKNNPIIS